MKTDSQAFVNYIQRLCTGPLLAQTVHAAALENSESLGAEVPRLWRVLVAKEGALEAQQKVARWIAKPRKLRPFKPVFPPVSAIRALLVELKKQIADEYRCTDDSEDDTPGMCVTIGADGKGRGSWSYQTGDNSFTGGAYGFPHWAVVYLHRRDNSTELARAAVEELHELAAD